MRANEECQKGTNRVSHCVKNSINFSRSGDKSAVRKLIQGYRLQRALRALTCRYGSITS